MKLDKIIQEDMVIICHNQEQHEQVVRIIHSKDLKANGGVYTFEKSITPDFLESHNCIRPKNLKRGSLLNYSVRGRKQVTADDFIRDNSGVVKSDSVEPSQEVLKFEKGDVLICIKDMFHFNKKCFTKGKSYTAISEYAILDDDQEGFTVTTRHSYFRIEPKQEVPSVEVGKCYTVKKGNYEWCMRPRNIENGESDKNFKRLDADYIRVDRFDIFRKECIAYYSLSNDSRRFTETPQRLPWLNYCIENNKFISEDEFNNMCKPQSVQLECRNSTCKFNTGSGNCSSESPSITIHDNAKTVCWTENPDISSTKPKKDFNNVGCVVSGLGIKVLTTGCKNNAHTFSGVIIEGKHNYKIGLYCPDFHKLDFKFVGEIESIKFK